MKTDLKLGDKVKIVKGNTVEVSECNDLNVYLDVLKEFRSVIDEL